MQTNPTRNAFLIGGGIGNLAAAAFMIRDAGIPGHAITLFESLPVEGGSLDGSGDAHDGYTLRGGRMLTTDNYECTWDLFRSIPSLEHPGRSVQDETIAFNARNPSHSNARLVDRNRSHVDVTSMGFSVQDRLELLTLAETSEDKLGESAITDWLSPAFFETSFWYMWATTFAFQPWHSAVEFKRYLHRFMKEFSRIETLAGVKRTVYNQYDSFVRPLVAWLRAQGVKFEPATRVTDIEFASREGRHTVTGLRVECDHLTRLLPVAPSDLVFFTNASMTDASSFGSMTSAPPRLTKDDSAGWALWEKIAEGRPEFGRPAGFSANIAQSWWESFTVTLRNPAFFDQMERFTGNRAGTGGLVTFKDSRWLMSVVLAFQPHFSGQPEGVQVFWGYALHPDRVGDFVAKPMADCTGEEILRELCGHLNFDVEQTFQDANCIPCRLPYITSMFMPRAPGDRPDVVPASSSNLAFVSQFAELPQDVVFTVEYSVRAAQTAVYRLLGVERAVPPVTPHDRSLHVMIDALVKAFK
jgi:oleate hydratase